MTVEILPRTPRKTKRADARRVARRALLQVITDVPDRAVVRRVDRGLRVILPAQRTGLRRFSRGQHGLAQGKASARIVGETRREALAGEFSRPAVRVADADVAARVDGWTGHPPKCAVRRVGSLLVDLGLALSIETELVPSHAAAAGLRVHGMHGDDGLV